MTGGRFRATSVKIMQDGVAENGTAAMLEPYLDRCGHPTDNRGHSFVEAGALREAVAALDAAGFQVHVHAIGDRGVREALDAFEGTDPERRHHIAHLQLVHPDDVPRFATLGVDRQHAGAVGLPGRADDRPDAAVPRAGAVALAVPLRRPPPRRRRAVRGQRLAGHHARPAGRDPHRGHPDGVRRGRPRRDRAVPARAGADPRDGVRGVHVGIGADQRPRPPRRRRCPGARRRGRPGRARPGPFAGPPEEIGATRVVSTWVAGERVFEA